MVHYIAGSDLDLLYTKDPKPQRLISNNKYYNLNRYACKPNKYTLNIVRQGILKHPLRTVWIGGRGLIDRLKDFFMIFG